MEGEIFSDTPIQLQPTNSPLMLFLAIPSLPGTTFWKIFGATERQGDMTVIVFHRWKLLAFVEILCGNPVSPPPPRPTFLCRLSTVTTRISLNNQGPLVDEKPII